MLGELHLLFMLLAFVVCCVFIEAIFTALEVALGAMARSRLRDLAEAETATGDKPGVPALRARRTLRLLDDAPRLSLLFITVTSLSLWTAASLLTWQSLLENWPAWALPASLVGVLFVAEVLPVLIAAPRAEAIALRGAGLLEATAGVLSPLLWLMGGAGRGLAFVLGAGRRPAPQVTTHELRSALAAAEEEGAIESGERALLEGAMDFRDKIVREVMTSRMDITGVPGAAGLQEVLETAINEGHSRLPVYEGDLDTIVGVVSTKDLIPFLRDGTSTRRVARDVARQPFFVPENKRIAATLDDLRKQRTLMAIVVNDAGSTTGLVTLEDLLEEIVGDIQDETDQEEPELEVLAPRTLRCAAGLTVREAERFWEKSFRENLALKNKSGQDADDSITLAALALHWFDGVPSAGERIEVGNLTATPSAGTGGASVEDPGVELEVLTMSGPRIEWVKLKAAIQVELPPADEEV